MNDEAIDLTSDALTPNRLSSLAGLGALSDEDRAELALALLV